MLEKVALTVFFASSYEIKSLPKYILIDKEGKFNQINAPSPDSEKLKIELVEK